MYIILIGMMGSGKSHVGKELAALLALPMLDLDTLLQESFGRPIADVFAQWGEVAFRQREAELMLDLAKHRRSAVLALGGGSVLAQDGMQALKQVGKVVFLRTDVVCLAKRLTRSRHKRPLVANAPDLQGKLTDILTNRQSLYEGYADFSVDTEDKTPSQVAALIAAWWKEGHHEL